MVPFPEALALHLVELGYITSGQSAELGYDPARIGAERKRAMEEATVRYEEAVAHGWFVISNEGGCVQAKTRPRPPISSPRTG